jgi:hypothetical protein
MHIADFAFPRKEFRVWCADHVDEAPAEAVVFEMLADNPYDEWDDPLAKKGACCAITGPNAGLRGGNHPNMGPMKDSLGAVDSDY